MSLTEEQMQLVQREIPVITLMLTFYKKFGKDALAVIRKWAFNEGRRRGEEVKRRRKIHGTEAKDVVHLYDTASRESLDKETLGKNLTRYFVKGNTVRSISEGFCPIMTAVQMLNAPWNIVCPNYSWQFDLGMAAAINPNVKQKILKTRLRGDKCCDHIIIVE